jgi:hypothetical protein
LIESPGESLTGVLGPGGFGKGGGVWQLANASAAAIRKAKEPEEGNSNARLRQPVPVFCNCRPSHIRFLFCIMQSCLFDKTIDRQAKYVEVDKQVQKPDGHGVVNTKVEMHAKR